MKEVIVFTGSGPLLILTTYISLSDPNFLKKLASNGIRKFIAYDLPLEMVKDIYGSHFNAIMNDVQQTDDLRVLDYNGHNVFYNFSFKNMGEPFFYEEAPDK